MARPTLEEVSETMFGRKMRLPLAIRLLDAEPGFYAAQLSGLSGFSAAHVGDELERFEKLGMLRRRPKTEGDRAKRYERTDSPLWGIITAARGAT